MNSDKYEEFDPYSVEPSEWTSTSPISRARYRGSEYRTIGSSGLQISPISIGCWRNFGEFDDLHSARQRVLHAFNRGITHFDLANNYGRPPGSAEETLGAILKRDLFSHRHELLVSTKAGYDMWAGPYGSGGSKKYLRASLDASLLRLGLEYVDIFYSHRYDASVPLEETADALEYAVASGKTNYVGISSYPVAQAVEITRLLKERNIRVLAYQGSYSIMSRWSEESLQQALTEMGIGYLAFSSLAQGMLVSKPSPRRRGTLPIESFSVSSTRYIEGLRVFADSAGHPLETLALAWVLRKSIVSSVVLGVATVQHIDSALDASSVDEQLVREFGRAAERLETEYAPDFIDVWGLGRDQS